MTRDGSDLAPARGQAARAVVVEPIDAIREALRRGEETARERLRRAVAARRGEVGEHAAWGRLCEEAGEPGLAVSEYQLALRDAPDDASALARLAMLYEEGGELDRAVECAERWTRAAPAAGEAWTRLVELLLAAGYLARAQNVLAEGARVGVPGELLDALAARVAAAREGETEEAEEGAEPRPPSDGEVVRFAHLFAGRENVYARQWIGPGGEGGYTPVREPLTIQVARNHLLGSVTVGVYPLRLDNTVTFFAFDVDLTRRALGRARSRVLEARRLKDLVHREARRLQAALGDLGVPALLEDSGYKGRHLWVFLQQPEDAAVVRTFGRLFLAIHGPREPDLHVEFFPKQARAEGGVGNLIKLPLGIHRRSGRRSRLLRPDGSPDPEPHVTLRRQPRLTREVLHAAIARLKGTLPGGAGLGPGTAGGRGEEPETGGENAATGVRSDPTAFPPVPPSWTNAHFDTHPEVAPILAHCPVLAALRQQVETHRRLSHDEQLVLIHALGHTSAGVLAVNYLLDACVDVPPTARLQSPLAGNPISCPKIRKRIPHVTARVPCHCRFDFAPGRYPTPRLHLLRPEVAHASGRAEPTGTAPDPATELADRVRALRVLRIRHAEVEAELRRVEAELVAYLEQAAVPELTTPEGILRLVQEEGAVAALVWEPAGEPVEQAGADEDR